MKLSGECDAFLKDERVTQREGSTPSCDEVVDRLEQSFGLLKSIVDQSAEGNRRAQEADRRRAESTQDAMKETLERLQVGMSELFMRSGGTGATKEHQTMTAKLQAQLADVEKTKARLKQLEKDLLAREAKVHETERELADYLQKVQQGLLHFNPSTSLLRGPSSPRESSSNTYDSRSTHKHRLSSYQQPQEKRRATSAAERQEVTVEVVVTDSEERACPQLEFPEQHDSGKAATPQVRRSSRKSATIDHSRL